MKRMNKNTYFIIWRHFYQMYARNTKNFEATKNTKNNAGNIKFSFNARKFSFKIQRCQ